MNKYFLATLAILGMANAQPNLEDIEAKLHGAKILRLEQSEVNGIYEMDIAHDGTLFPLYITSDGQYMIEGNITNLNDSYSISEARSKKITTSTLNNFNQDHYITYSPRNKSDQTRSITVFTDINCPFCKRLHDELDQYLAAGIEVKYAALPVISSRQRMESVWCSNDPKKAIDEAFTTRYVDNNIQCYESSPVAASYSLGSSLGISATPHIILDDGTAFNGYIPAQQIIRTIRSRD